MLLWKELIPLVMLVLLKSIFMLGFLCNKRFENMDSDITMFISSSEEKSTNNNGVKKIDDI